jgi:hypothetical protein
MQSTVAFKEVSKQSLRRLANVLSTRLFDKNRGICIGLLLKIFGSSGFFGSNTIFGSNFKTFIFDCSHEHRIE